MTALSPPTPDTVNGLQTPANDQAQALFGISFDGIARAEEFMLALSRLAGLGHLKLRDAAVIAKDGDGKVRVRETWYDVVASTGAGVRGVEAAHVRAVRCGN